MHPSAPDRPDSERSPPQLAAIVREESAEILARCAGPDADNATARPALSGRLDAAATALAGGPTPPGDADDDARAAASDFSALRRAIFQRVGCRLGRAPAMAEALALNAAIDAALCSAVASASDRQQGALLAANEAHAKALSYFSHDLRGGLNAALLSVEVARRELAARPEFAETAADLDASRRAVLDVVASMNGFLFAERFRMGRVRFKPAPLGLGLLLGELRAQFMAPARRKGLELTARAPEGARITSDRELLSLALHSLIANAIKYSDRGAVRITAEPTPAGAGWRFEVADEGPGFDEARRRELFVDPRPGAGGRGLLLARQAAALLGATLWADATPGAGARVYLETPSASSQVANQ